MATDRQSSTTQIMWAAALVSGATIFSRLLGFVRDAIIAGYFGQTASVDQYNAAYVIPDTLYLLLIGGAISSAFVPVVSEYLSHGQDDEAERVVNIALNLVLVFMLPLVGLGILLAPWLVQIVAIGFTREPGAVAHTAYLTRIMLGAVVFHAINGVLVGQQYARKSFWATAIGPLFYNVGIIVVGALFGRIIGIQAFAWGVLIGAFVNFVIQAWGVLRLGFRYRWVFDLYHPGLVRIARLMLPVAFGVGLSQLNLIINQTFLASLLPAGDINALRLASRIMLTPVSLASSLAITLLPNLTELATQGRLDAFRQYLSTGLRVVIFVTLPSSVGLLLLGHPLVAALFRHGRFDAHNVTVTAGALTFYTLGIVAYGGIEIVVRGFYAVQDTRTPVIIDAVVVVTGFLLSWVLLHVMAQNGLALAYSLVGYLNLLLLTIWLSRRIRGLDGRRVLRTLVRSAMASLIMGFGLELALTAAGPWLTEGRALVRGLLLLGVIGLGMAVYGLAARRLHLEEYDMIARRLKRRLVPSA
jgi:putative peptidoglycan lipid II flippase